MRLTEHSFFQQEHITTNYCVNLPIIKAKGVQLWIKRDDQIHDFVSGNKFRKLKYNIEAAKRQHKQVLVTFGGAYSNHIVATAVAGKLTGLNTVGFIRGDEIAQDLPKFLNQNDSLRIAYEHGMQFEFISREEYRKKDEASFLKQLKNRYPDSYLIPEGGTNELAIKGCEEILNNDHDFNIICSSVGTGGTITGLINSVQSHQRIIGFPALKGDFLDKTIEELTTVRDNWILNTSYHFGGYAKVNSVLIQFINNFFKHTGVLLDPIYTGKMMYGIVDLIKNNYFEPNSKILAIHTGGLQGIKGVNAWLKRKNLEIIQES